MNAITNPRAVCCLIMNKAGQILSVSRRDNHSDFGLPGGKVENNEALYAAAERELFEETGVHVESMRPVFMMIDSSGYETTTFLVIPEGEPHFTTEENHIVKWSDKSTLLNGCTFAKYNNCLFDVMSVTDLTFFNDKEVAAINALVINRLYKIQPHLKVS